VASKVASLYRRRALIIAIVAVVVVVASAFGAFHPFVGMWDGPA
jgi:hypothetical protein